MHTRASIILIDPDSKSQVDLHRRLATRGVDVRVYTCLKDGLPALRSRSVPLPDIWTEALLPDGSGLDVVDAAQVRETPVVVMSSHPESELVFTAYARGAYDCVFKPLDDTCLDELVEW